MNRTEIKTNVSTESLIGPNLSPKTMNCITHVSSEKYGADMAALTHECSSWKAKVFISSL